MDSDILTLVRQYLKKYYPELPPLSKDQIQFLITFGGRVLYQRSIRFTIDHFLENIPYCDGYETLSYTLEEWKEPSTCTNSIPGPYRFVFDALDKAAYKIYEKHRLNRFGSQLILIKPTPICDKFGKNYLASHKSWPLYSHDYSLVLNAVDIEVFGEWDIHQPAIEFRPLIYIGSKRMESFEKELCAIALKALLEEIKIKEIWMPVFRCLYNGVTNSQQISQITGLNSTTVNYYNAEILTAIRAFSTQFSTAKEGVDYLKRQGFLLL